MKIDIRKNWCAKGTLKCKLGFGGNRGFRGNGCAKGTFGKKNWVGGERKWCCD